MICLSEDGIGTVIKTNAAGFDVGLPDSIEPHSCGELSCCRSEMCTATLLRVTRGDAKRYAPLSARVPLRCQSPAYAGRCCQCYASRCLALGGESGGEISS
jgi:hypothetical protein